MVIEGIIFSLTIFKLKPKKKEYFVIETELSPNFALVIINIPSFLIYSNME